MITQEQLFLDCVFCHLDCCKKLCKHLDRFKNSFFQSVADIGLQSLGSLEYLDLSRNLIREINPGTFLGMANLKGLDFSVNVVRKVSINK